LPEAPRDAEAGVAGLQILIVEDEPDAREFLALLLASRGAVVRTAASGAEAVVAMTEQRPDLLLADLRMSGEDGYSLIRRWRAYEGEHPGSRVAAIAVTAYASTKDRDLAIAAGFDSHVAKPVDVAVLTQPSAARANPRRPPQGARRRERF
jgi:CheY-like chemotaxis protein